MYIPDVMNAILPNAIGSLVDIRRNAITVSLRKRVKQDKKYLVASSGGSDSLSLVVSLACVLENIDNMHVVHIDHGLRDNAYKDANLAMLQAWSVGAQFTSVKIQVPKKGNVYAKGREARYYAISEVCREIGADFLLTAHHADDLVETLFMRLRRGTPLRSCNFIAENCSMFGVHIQRPLLRFTKEELRHLARLSGIAWAEDPSNLNIERERACFRHKIQPHLNACYPNFAKKVANSVLLNLKEDNRLGLAPQ